ncbi:MAG: hypothetical protein ABUL62_29235 [Myxococcales bacterium]
MATRWGSIELLLCASLLGGVALTPRDARCEPRAVWSPSGAPLTSPSAGSAASFGTSVAISGGTAVVGSASDNLVAIGAGAAYPFTRVGSQWLLQGDVLHTVGAGGAHLGYPCALQGDTVFCGTSQGIVYSFERVGGAWSTGQPLVSDDPAPPDWAFPSLSIDGDVAFVGIYVRLAVNHDNPGAAYIFERSGGSWAQVKRLELVTRAVSVSGHSAVVAEISSDGGGSSIVRTFERQDAGWEQRGAALHQPDGFPSTQFGIAVALDHDTLLVAGTHLTPSGATAGAVYAFTRDGDSWTFHGPPLEPTQPDETFGWNVSLSGDVAAVAARGKAYFLERIANEWQFAGAPLPGAPNYSNSMLAVSGQYAIVGNAGSAQIYTDACLVNGDCPANAACDSGTCRERCSSDIACGEVGAGGASDSGSAGVTDTGNGGLGVAGEAGVSESGEAGASHGGTGAGGARSTGGASGGRSDGSGFAGAPVISADAGGGGTPSAGAQPAEQTATSCGCRLAPRPCSAPEVFTLSGLVALVAARRRVRKRAASDALRPRR